MHHNHFEALQLVQKLSYLLTNDDYDAVDVSVHPPFTDLRTVQTYFISEKEPIPIALGAQNCHAEEKGAFTGEVSAPMLAKLDVRYVIAGHSERRELFGETDELVNAKVHAILKAAMTPILCCGETLEEREAGSHRGEGHRPGAGGPGRAQRGPGRRAGDRLRADLGDRHRPHGQRRGRPGGVRPRAGGGRRGAAGAEAAASVRIQYGGSVKPTNAAELMGQPDIDGALVGGASLEADDFARIVQYRL